ncbi:MAG: hypothetical protein KJ077_11045 [Anaerolineae bacterium]|nr:hypothetical protein [Anaerolineae bacterium]
MPHLLVFKPGDEHFRDNIRVIRAERITHRHNKPDIRLRIRGEYKFVSYVRIMPDGKFVEYDGWRAPIEELSEVALPISALQRPQDTQDAG